MVIGVDGSPDGWVCVVVDGTKVRACHVSTISSVEEFAVPDAIVAIDIPMWFPSAPPRRAEVAARQRLGIRSSSIFPTPVREAIEAPDHATANARSRAACGAGVSRQAFALAPKILEVDAWRRATTLDVFEVHPETSFAVLLGAPAQHSKKTWAGSGERRRALAAAGLDLAPFEGVPLGRAAVDDVVDAAAAAWTALRIEAGTAIRLPGDPGDEPDDVIWA